MELTTEMIEYCEKQPWDDDDRQDVYVRVLEHEGEPSSVNNAWLSRMYTNLRNNRARDDARRREIVGDAQATLAGMVSDDNTADPLDILMSQEEIENRVSGLSTLLYDTLVSHVVHGATPHELAVRYDVKEEVIYKRLQRARELVKGEE